MEKKPQVAYTFTEEQNQKISGADRNKIETCFRSYDRNGDQNMDSNEFKALMMDMGMVKRTGENPAAEVQGLLDKYD